MHVWCAFLFCFSFFSFFFFRGGTENSAVFHSEWNLGVRLCQPIHSVLPGDLGQRTEPTYSLTDTVPVPNTGHARAREQPAATGTATQWVLQLPHLNVPTFPHLVKWCSLWMLICWFKLFTITSKYSTFYGWNEFFFLSLAALAAEDLSFERFHSILQ